MVEEIAKKYKAGERVEAVIAPFIEKAKNDTLNIFREVFSDIETQVARAQAMLDGGKGTALTGIPVAIKDNILFAGHAAGASSKILEGYVASYDSTVVEKLIAAGAIIIGRTNMDEFAMGSSTENSAYGVTKNPHDQARVPGGSSGGSAAAVGGAYAALSLGSDTGGSIRQPAAFCGVVGLLPTYGSVSRHGLMALGSSLDTIGPFAHTVDDAELLYRTIAGKDAFDATSMDHPGLSDTPVLKKRIALPKGIFEMEGMDEEVRASLTETVDKMKEAGFTVDEVALPHYSYSLAVYYIVMPAEASSNLARFDGIRYGARAAHQTIHDLYGETRGEGFGPEPRRRILLGTYVLSHGYYDAYYTKATKLRTLIRDEITDALKGYDALLTPTTPTPAFKIGEKANDPVAMYLSDLFTVPANIAQCPALSVPWRKTKGGLPLGMQFLGPQFSEPTLFALGKVIESIR